MRTKTKHSDSLEEAKNKQNYTKLLEELYNVSIEQDSEKIKFYYNLAILFKKNNHFQESSKILKRLVDFSPTDCTLYNLLAENALSLGNKCQATYYYQQTVNIHKKYLELKMHCGEAYNYMGCILEEEGLEAPAEQAFLEATKVNPLYCDPYNNLGVLSLRRNNTIESINFYEKVLKINPHHALAHNNIGIALQKQGKHFKALYHYEKSIRLSPTPQAYKNLGWSLLFLGDLEKGWEYFEYRFKEGSSLMSKRDTDKPLWNGEDLKGKRLLIRAEQGFGDTIQFARYFSIVAKLGAKIIFETQPALKKLLSNIPSIDTLIDQNTPFPDFDYYIPLMSLAHILKTTSASIPNEELYKYIQPKKSYNLHIPSQGFKKKIGFVWAGNPAQGNDINRSCNINHYSEIFKAFPHVNFYSLQVGIRSAEFQKINLPNVHDLSPLLKDFSDTAEAIMQLDLVITVDTSVAHLAGALGKPTWVLLSYVPDWRWQSNGLYSPWYASMLLFRQDTTCQWNHPIQEIIKKLQVFAPPEGNEVGIQKLQDLLVGECNKEGKRLALSGLLSEAKEYFHKAAQLNQNSSETYYNLGCAYLLQHDYANSKKYYLEAVRINNGCFKSYNNLGNIYTAEHDFDKAKKCYKEAINRSPHSAGLLKNLGMLHLLLGEFDLGWALFEQRFLDPREVLLTCRKIDQPKWQGEDLQGKRILVRAEQGFGDTIQFIRYLPLLASKGANIIFETQPALRELLLRLKCVGTIITSDLADQALPAFDYHIPLLSLPYAFKTDINSIPSEDIYKQFYASPNPSLQQITGRNPLLSCLRVGIVWASDSGHATSKQKSCPLEFFSHLFTVNKASFYSLQVGRSSKDIEKIINTSPSSLKNDSLTKTFCDNNKPFTETFLQRIGVSNEQSQGNSDSSLPQDINVYDLSPYIRTFSDTASFILQLDLVITIDTAVAHLAAALGKPTWVLLPYSADWRWLTDRQDSPWYRSMKIFRQTRQNDWWSIIKQIKDNLEHKF
ncbi:MAG: glycosyl transferase group 1,tetratricopeptide repeat proteintetratricopeptide repeat protein [Chlamydiales bacterium]|jgi:tetratricopeptide (TPR) repeat protein|nr:glycosyl transferase group 1,tetratricopeptide repeat proteintetratricopeptide repeat protein [Chlamydiales bacterium]